MVSVGLSAGAARAEIGLDGALPLNGFGFVHDPLYVRTLVLDDDDARAVIVLIDQTSLGQDLVTETKTVASQLADVPSDAVLVIASHTFSAPHVLSAELVPAGETAARARLAEAIGLAVSQSVTAAVGTLRPSHVRAGAGQTSVGVNRDVNTPQGWWLGADPAGPTDPVLPVVVFDDDAGRAIAVIASLAVQSSVCNERSDASGLRPVSSDLSGAGARSLETDGAVALVVTGAAGDQAPRPLQGNTFRRLDLLGRELGADLRKAAAAAQPISASPLRMQRSSVTLDAQVAPRDIRDIAPSRDYAFRLDGTVNAPWVTLRLGDVALVGVQPELSAATGIALQTASDFAYTLVMTLTDGGAKYMADALAYDRITYEAMNSKYARGSAERFVTAIAAQLRTLHSQAPITNDSATGQKRTTP